MPHLLVQNFSIGKLPLVGDDCEILDEFFSLKNSRESLLFARHQGEEFFIRKIQRNQAQLLKAEKITKPNPVGILKNTLRFLAQKAVQNQATILSSNLGDDMMRQKNQSLFFLKEKNFANLFFKNFFLEIGFGSGRHLLDLAKQNPHKIYIGIEIHTPSIEQILRQIQLQKLQNLYIACIDARILLETLPPNKCKGIYMHFPVPWNNKPHRRVMSQKFLLDALRVLKTNAFFEMRSDDEKYFRDSFEIALACDTARIEIIKNLSTCVVSKYEARWQKQGKNIFNFRIFSLANNNKGKKIKYNFIFNFKDFAHLSDKLFDLGRLTRVPKVIGENFFVQICEVFQSKSGDFVLVVSFGNFNRPVNKIIVFSKIKAGYFNSDPLPTQDNIKAHKALFKILSEAR